MVFEIIIFKLMENHKRRVYTSEINARDGVEALQKACIKFTPDRIVEIRQIEHSITRPPINRTERNGGI